MLSFFEDHFRISRIYLKKLFPFFRFCFVLFSFFYIFALGFIYY